MILRCVIMLIYFFNINSSGFKADIWGWDKKELAEGIRDARSLLRNHKDRPGLYRYSSKDVERAKNRITEYSNRLERMYWKNRVRKKVEEKIEEVVTNEEGSKLRRKKLRRRRKRNKK